MPESSPLQERELVLRALEVGSPLRERRLSFLMQLRDGLAEDGSMTQRQARQRAQELTQKADDARWLERCVALAADKFEIAVLESLYWSGVWSGGPVETAPHYEDIERIKFSTIAELRKRRRIAQKAAQWHRNVVPQKPTQWGPATLEAVTSIVREASQAFSEKDLRRSVKPEQRGEYYAGLLCMETGILASVSPDKVELIAERVRKRLDRGESLRLASKDYPSYTPLKRRNHAEASAWFVRKFKS
jgi:hypothetical protein